MRIGNWIIAERAGETPPDPVPVPKPSRRLTPRQAYAVLMSARDVVLPVSGLEVRFSPPTMRVMVDAGLTIAATIPFDHKLTEAEAEAHMDRVRVQARRLICAASEAPVFRPHPNDSQLDIALMPDEDLLYGYNLLVEWGSSIFYGTHRADLRPADDPAWIEAQQQAAGILDQVARRYGVLPTELERLSPLEFARVAAIAEAGNAADDGIRRAMENAPKPKGRR